MASEIKRYIDIGSCHQALLPREWSSDMAWGGYRLVQEALGTRPDVNPRSRPVQDRYVRVGEVRTRYRSAGETGHSLILIHGIGASLESWMYNMQPLAHHHRVFALDLVWFGKSDKPACQVSGKYFSDFIAGFMDAVGVQQATLVGNSMGGMIAVKTALQYPERVRGLVLVSSAGFGRELSWWLRLNAVFAIGGWIPFSLRSARQAARHLVYDPNVLTDELIKVMLDLGMQPDSWQAFRRVLQYGVDWRGLRPQVLRGIRDAAHTLRIPTLIVWGKQDRMVPVAHAQVAQQRIPNAELHIFDQCGHAPMIEKADQFNALVTQFIRERITCTPSPRAAKDRSLPHS